MREIKFRQFIGGEFRYWGFGVMPDEAQFASPVTSSDGDVYPSQQYTGLKDRSGIKIYEGDIVQIYKHMSNEKGEVNLVEWDAEKHQYKGIYPNIAIWSQHEIIGNIYETPELLKEEE